MYNKYIEIQPERAIQGNFSSGQFNIIWNLPKNTKFNPSKSFIKITTSLKKGNNDALDLDFGVSYNYYVCDNLFQQVRQKINGIPVGELNDFVSQTAALHNRMNISQTLKESRMSSTNYSQIYLQDRINDVSSDGRKYHDYQFKTPAGDLSLDITTPNQYSVAITGILSLTANGGNPIPNVNTLFDIGDFIQYEGNNNDFVAGEILSFPTDASIQLSLGSNTQLVVNAKNITNDNFKRIRKHIPTLRNNYNEFIWRPCLGFWNLDEFVCGHGDYCLELTPINSSVLSKYAIESVSDKKEGTTINDIKFEVINVLMYLYVEINGSESVKTQSFLYEDINCNSQNITTSSLDSKEFFTHDNNIGLTVAFQDKNVGNDSTLSRSKFKISDNKEQLIDRYYIINNGITLPDPLPSLINSQNSLLLITQRYYENFGYSNNLDLLKVESLKEFIDAGIYFHHKFGIKDSPYKNNVQVYTKFSDSNFPSANLLLFDHYLCNLTLKIKDDKIDEVILL